MRGSYSNHSSYCGAFFVTTNYAVSVATWASGAALSFKPLSTHYTFRGGRSSHGTTCGVFCINVVYDTSSAYWDIGAAL